MHSFGCSRFWEAQLFRWLTKFNSYLRSRRGGGTVRSFVPSPKAKRVPFVPLVPRRRSTENRERSSNGAHPPRHEININHGTVRVRGSPLERRPCYGAPTFLMSWNLKLSLDIIQTALIDQLVVCVVLNTENDRTCTFRLTGRENSILFRKQASIMHYILHCKLTLTKCFGLVAETDGDGG